MFAALVLAVALAVGGSTALALLAGRPGASENPTQLADALPAHVDCPGFPAGLVSFVLSGCAPGAQAYEATILDLAARGQLTAEVGTDNVRLTVTGRGARGPSAAEADAANLTVYERQVLADATSRMSTSGSAPVTALADACRADVHGIWEPFGAALRADARRRGLCRPMLPVTAKTVLASLMAGAGIAGAAFVITRLIVVASDPQAGFGRPGSVAALTLFICGCFLRWLAKRDRLTALGSALAERCQRLRAALAADGATSHGTTPADLRGAALAVAAGAVTVGTAGAVTVGTAGAAATLAPGTYTSSGAGARRRARRGRTTPPQVRQRPAEAWSSFSGTWRAVEIRANTGSRVSGGFVLFAAAAWAGVIAFAASVFSGSVPLTVILAGGSAALAVAGARRLAMHWVVPTRTSFDGQVIARWQEDDYSENNTGRLYYVAVDDAQRAWTFCGPTTYQQVALGDLVRVTANPRSSQLIDLTLTARRRTRGGDGAGTLTGSGHAADVSGPTDAIPAPEASTGPRSGWSGSGKQNAVRRAAEPLLMTAEATQLVGPVSRVTPAASLVGHATIFRGRDGTLSLIVSSGGVASFGAMIGRHAGTRLAGIGDEAWLLNRRRTVIARVGRQIVKLTVNLRAGMRGPDSGLPGGPEQLVALATTISARLASQRAGKVL